MHVTAVEGIVENGRIRLREPIRLPENARVYVIVPEGLGQGPPQARSPRLANPAQAGEFQKQVLEVQPTP